MSGIATQSRRQARIQPRPADPTVDLQPGAEQGDNDDEFGETLGEVAVLEGIGRHDRLKD